MRQLVTQKLVIPRQYLSPETIHQDTLVQHILLREGLNGKIYLDNIIPWNNFGMILGVWQLSFGSFPEFWSSSLPSGDQMQAEEAPHQKQNLKKNSISFK